jgi:hypothetical protein
MAKNKPKKSVETRVAPGDLERPSYRERQSKRCGSHPRGPGQRGLPLVLRTPTLVRIESKQFAPAASGQVSVPRGVASVAKPGGQRGPVAVCGRPYAPRPLPAEGAYLRIESKQFAPAASGQVSVPPAKRLSAPTSRLSLPPSSLSSVLSFFPPRLGVSAVNSVRPFFLRVLRVFAVNLSSNCLKLSVCPTSSSRGSRG